MRNFQCHYNNPSLNSGTAGIPVPFTTCNAYCQTSVGWHRTVWRWGQIF